VAKIGHEMKIVFLLFHYRHNKSLLLYHEQDVLSINHSYSSMIHHNFVTSW